MPKRDKLISDAERERMIFRLAREAGVDTAKLALEDDKTLVEWLSILDCEGPDAIANH